MDLTKLKNLIKGKQDSKKDLKLLTPKKGLNRYVILPGWNPVDRETFFHDYGEHWVKNPFEKNEATGNWKVVAKVVCEAKTRNGFCPVCQALREALDNCRNDGERNQLKREFGTSQRYLLNVLALDSETPNEPQILAIGSMAFDMLLDILSKWSSQIFNESNPQIVTITRQGEGIGTNYLVSIDPSTYPLPAGTYEKLHDLDKFCAPTNVETVARALPVFKAFGVEVNHLLPAPVRGAVVGETPALPAFTQAKAPEIETVTPEVVVSAPATPAQPAVASAPVQAKPAPVASTPSIDDNLDSLLAGLNVEASQGAEEDIPF